MTSKKIERYHYVESGLDYIYLVGIRENVCVDCVASTVEIPNVRNLHLAIALGIIENPKPLIGSEIRFLRKVLGMKAKDLARKLGYQPEVLSRYENDKEQMGEQGDRLLRVIFWGEKQSEIGLYKPLLEVMNSFEPFNPTSGVFWVHEDLQDRVRKPLELDPRRLPVQIHSDEAALVN